MSYFLPFEESRDQRYTVTTLLERLLRHMQKMAPEDRAELVKTINWIEPQTEVLEFSAWSKEAHQIVMQKTATDEPFYGEPHRVSMVFPAQILAKFHDEDFLLSVCEPKMFNAANYIQGHNLRDGTSVHEQNFEGMFSRAVENKNVAALKVCLKMVAQNSKQQQECERWFTRSDHRYLNLLCSWDDHLSDQQLFENMDQIESVCKLFYVWSKANSYGVFDKKAKQVAGVIWEDMMDALEAKSPKELMQRCATATQKAIKTMGSKKLKEEPSWEQKIHVEWEHMMSDAFERCVERAHVPMVQWFLQKPRLALVQPEIAGRFIESAQLQSLVDSWVKRVNEMVVQTSEDALIQWCPKAFTNGYREDHLESSRVNQSVISAVSRSLGRVLESLETKSHDRGEETQYRKVLNEHFMKNLPMLLDHLKQWSQSPQQLPWLNVYSEQVSWETLAQSMKKNARVCQAVESTGEQVDGWLETVQKDNVRPYVLALIRLSDYKSNAQIEKAIIDAPFVEGELQTLILDGKLKLLCKKIDKNPSWRTDATLRAHWEEQMLMALKHGMSGKHASYEKQPAYSDVKTFLDDFNTVAQKYPVAFEALQEPIGKALHELIQNYGSKRMEESLALWETLVLRFGLQKTPVQERKPNPLRV